MRPCNVTIHCPDFQFRGPQSWPNVLRWAERLYLGCLNFRIPAPRYPHEQSAVADLLGIMFLTVVKMRPLAWCELEDVLDGYHQILRNTHEAWD